MGKIHNYVSPGTVSNILWHFTGGPKWNESAKKQSSTGKSDEEAYNNLKSILRKRELRLGSYKETVKYVIPKQKIYDLDTMEERVERNVSKTFESMPVCCVAEIPIQHLSYHSKRYGKFAIGFYRESLIKSKFRPVTYSISGNNLIDSLIEAYEGMVFTRRDLQSMPNVVDKHFDSNKNNEDAQKMRLLKYLLVQHGRRIEYMERATNIYLAYIKTITKSELHTIYCEREWRSLESYNFDFRDIAFIILPRSHFMKHDYRDEVGKFAEELNVPRYLPIVPWEDVIEE